MSSTHHPRPQRTAPPPTPARPDAPLPHASPPLWQLLGASAQAMQAIIPSGPRQPQAQHRAHHPSAHNAPSALQTLAPHLRPGVQALLYTSLRHWGRAQALRQALAPRAPAPVANALLCTALALLCDDNPPYPAHTLVNQTVQAAHHLGLKAQAAFLNACLRRYLRERAALHSATDTQDPAQHNHPQWWIDKLRAQHPAHWADILRHNNTHAPMTLRVNRQHTTPAHYQLALHHAGLHATPNGPDGLLLHTPQPVQQLPGFAQGQVSVQDGAAQMAARLLLADLLPPAAQSTTQPQTPSANPTSPHSAQPTPAPTDGPTCTSSCPARPLHILDACAAPGGKTAHLLELLPLGSLHITALEIDPRRAQRIHDTLERTGLLAHAQVLCADAAQPAHWLPQVQTHWAAHHPCTDTPPITSAPAPTNEPGIASAAPTSPAPIFDRILLDAPCTASGIVRRQPDVRWLRREGDVAQLAATQAALLDALWPLLREGGLLLYATCSVFREEGEWQIRRFLRRTPSAQLHTPGAPLPPTPHPHNPANTAAPPTASPPPNANTTAHHPAPSHSSPQPSAAAHADNEHHRIHAPIHPGHLLPHTIALVPAEHPTAPTIPTSPPAPQPAHAHSPTLPPWGPPPDHDGFFYALLRKTHHAAPPT